MAYPPTGQSAERSAWAFGRLWTATFLCFGVLYAVTEPLTTVLSEHVSDPAARGGVLGVFGLTALVMRPATGWLADRAAPRWILGLGALAMAAGVGALALSTRLEVLILARALQAAGYAAFSTAGMAWANDLGSSSTRAARLARYGMAANLAMALVPAAMHPLMPTAPATSVLVWLAVVAVGAGACAHVDAPARLRRPAVRVGHDAVLGVARQVGPALSALAMLVGLAFGAFWQYTPLLVGDHVGLAFGIYGATILLTRAVGGPWLDRLTLTQVTGLSGGILILGLSALALSGSLQWPGVVIGSSAVGIGCGLLHPAVFAAAGRRAPTSVGLATGWCYAAFDLGLALSGWALGPLMGWLGAAGLFGVAAAAMAFVIMIGRGQHGAPDSSHQPG